jgi:signal transduction histidine kinase/CheY-like chemotaxis protein
MGSPGYLLMPLVAATAAALLIVLVIQGGQRDPSRRVFFLVLLCLALWAAATFFMRGSRTEGTATVWNRIVSVSLLALFAAFAHFCHVYIGKRSVWPIVLLYGLAASFSAVLLATDLAVRGMTRASYGWSPVVGPLGIALFACVYLLIISSLARLMRAWRREVSGDRRRRLISLTVAGSLPLLGIAADGFTDLPPMLVWANIAFCTVCSIAILRFRLFDLRNFARRGSLRLLVGALIATPFVGVIMALNAFFKEGESLLWIYLVSMAVYVLLMWPAYEWARWRLDRLFSSERFDHLRELRELARGADSLSGAHATADRLTSIVQRALGATAAALLEPVAGSRGLYLVSANGAGCTPADPILGEESPVVEWLKAKRTILPVRALAVEPVLQNLPQAERAALAELRAALLAPLLTSRGELAGVLVLGPRASRRQYSLDETQLLEALGAEAALALENTRLYSDAVRARVTLEAWLNSLPDIVAIVDRDDVIKFVNREGKQRIGAKPGDRSFLRAGAAAHDVAPRRLTETILGREYEIASAPLAEAGGQLSWVFVLRDVTERRQEQEKREQLEARARLASHLASIGEMASGIAHEINNPLTAVIGYSQLLGELELPGEAQEAVRQILQGSARVAGIVQRLLTFARQRKPQRTAVDMNEVIRSTLALRDYALRTGNIRATLRLDPALPRTIADAQQMQQVLLNLIVNAEMAMASTHGKGQLLIASGQQGREILITVQDDGPGVPREIQQRIFDPFFTTREVGKGTGLGLSICHGIVSEHGGRIWVQSEPGGGARFTVAVPVVDAGDAASPAGAQAAPAGLRSRILVVDDEPSIRALLTVLLEKQGHEVEDAADGQTAVSLVNANRYGVILLDVRMPDMSGLEVFFRVKAIAESITSRVIFMTGDVMADETRALLEKTGAPAVAKPFQPHEILLAIENVLRGPPS